MSLTKQEAESYIRMELRQWKLSNVKIEWKTFCHLGEADVSNNQINLSLEVLESAALLVEVVKHEIAHFLDYLERGTFEVNGRNVFHGKNWKKWCLTVGCRPRRLIPV
jgi:predicted SprT family Zn-dependent metalloprotease